jgi:hypothetical protein
MLTYNSGFNPPAPYTQQQRSDALSGLRMQSPYASYGQHQQDILNAAGDANAASFDVAASKAAGDFELQKMQAQQQLALSGLQQMAQAESQRRQLASSRLGTVSPLLQGLFT